MLRKVALSIASLALASAAVVAAAGEERHPVAGKVLLGFAQEVSLPDVKCVPSGGTSMPCPPGTTNVLDRLEVQTWAPVSPSRSVARFLKGSITFVVNCDLNAAYRGACWGTFEWKIDEGGTWAGFWNAPIMDLVTYESRLSMEGVGTGGEIDGRRLELKGASAPGDWYIASTVRIK